MNCPRLSTLYLLGWMLRLTPPASARSVRPSRRSWQARWTAVSELEHMVSTVMLGPCRFSAYDTRIDANLTGQITLVAVAGWRLLQIFAPITGVFHGHPGLFEEQAFLRVHVFGRTRRNIEKQRIELVDVINEAAPFAGVAAVRHVVLANIVLPVPAVGRYLGHAVAPVAQILPEFVDVFSLRIAPRQT